MKMNKRHAALSSLVLGALIGLDSQAHSVPNLINYQGKLTDAAGSPLPNGTYGVAVRLWNKKNSVQSGNTLIWGQEYNVAVVNGIFNLILGAPGGTPVTNAAVNDLSFAFTAAERYFGLTVTKGTNGVIIPNSNEILPRQQILTVPYAVTASFASTAQNVVNGTPPGSITPFAGLVAPSGWLVCNGAAVSRTTYSNLFAVVGTTYGSGDENTTFALPDCRGRTLIGAGVGGIDIAGRPLSARTLGQVGGEEVHQLSIDEMPEHYHSYHPNTGANGGVGTSDSRQAGTGQPQTVNTDTKGGSVPHNNMQPFVVVNYLIKH